MCAAPHATLKDKAYDRLKAMILAGELRPGQALTERDLGTHLGVSRTPVREALSRLQQEGLVESRPQRGYFVHAADAKTVEDLYELREMLELYAIKLAVKRAGDGDMAKFQKLAKSLKAYDKQTSQGAEELQESQRVHELIGEATQNELLLEMLKRVYDRLQMFIWIDALYADEAPLTRKEHQEIIAAFLAKDEARLTRLSRAHLDRSKKNVLRVLRARPSLAV